MIPANVTRGSILKAGILSGLLGAMLIAMPFLSALNLCCCCLIIASGALSAWMLRSDSQGSASTPRCALAGLLCGIVAALIGVPLGAMLSRLAFGAAHLEAQVAGVMEAVRQSTEGSGQPMPPGFLETVEAGLRATSGLEMNGWLFAAAIFSSVVHGFFGMLGGLLGALMTRASGSPPAAAPGLPSVAPIVVGPPTMDAPPAPAPISDVPPPPAPPVVDADGEPDVRWSGPVLEAGGDTTGSEDASGTERGEIPSDELPLLPPRELPEPPDQPPRQD